jgi:hypothetical protein
MMATRGAMPTLGYQTSSYNKNTIRLSVPMPIKASKMKTAYACLSKSSSRGQPSEFSGPKGL